MMRPITPRNLTPMLNAESPYQKLLRPRKKIDYTSKHLDDLLAEIISQDSILSDFSTCSSESGSNENKTESESSENETEYDSEEADGKKPMVDEKLKEEKDEAGNLEEDDQLEEIISSQPLEKNQREHLKRKRK
jgi:hypothetical protein